MSVIHTGDKEKYHFFPVTTPGILEFKVRAPKDAHICLSKDAKESNPMYEIFLGGWANSKSCIRRNRSTPDKVLNDTPDLLRPDADLGFWIRWENGLVRVGKEGEQMPLLMWNDPSPFVIRHYGIRTSQGATGKWTLRDMHTSNNLVYDFRPIMGPSLHFRVIASNDAHVALSPTPSDDGPMYEIVFGGWKNSKSAIRKKPSESEVALTATPKVLNKEEPRGFWITWTDGLIQVGREAEPTPFLMWKDPNPVPVKYFGVRTGFGSTGVWIVADTNMRG